MLRLMVMLLALLAGAKVWTQDTLFRAGAEEALVAAYRDRAITACQKLPPRRMDAVTAAVPPALWAKPQNVRMKTGSRNVDVHFWQVDSPLWNARYRNPYLILSGGEDALPVACEFDILYGTAVLIRI
jgi:hypothetical protein